MKNPDDFINSIDNSMRMKSSEILLKKIGANEDIVILDLRMNEKFEEEHIPTSINIEFKNFPTSIGETLPDKKQQIFCVCNGSVMSAMAVMYLFMGI